MKLAFFLAFILLFGCVSVPSPSGEQVTQAPTAPVAPATNESTTSTETMPDTEDDSEVVPDAVDDDVSEPLVPDTTETASIDSEEITYKSFGWEIHGTLYPAVNKKNPTVGIILVPMLDHDRASYPVSFIEDLHQKIPGAIILAIDARGHGESTNLGTWDDFQLEEWIGMGTDIKQAKKYFKDNYPTADEYYVVGASIGSTAAILAAEQENDITKVAMLSPGIEYKGVNIEDEVDDYVHPLLVVYTNGDAYSASSAVQINSITSSKTTLKSYSGSSHGTDMFDDTEVSSDLVDFLKK
jgi:alpha/beta superfamily hydrolase